MAIEGMEWLVVGLVILVVFLWGPEKLPQIARSLGKAKREFDKAMQGIENEVRQTTSTITDGVVSGLTPDHKLIDLAKTLGINTQGLTRDQIAKEILWRMSSKEAAGG